MPKLPRPKLVKGQTEQIPLGCGKLYITTNIHNGKLFEIFSTMGKAGGCARAQLEGLSRLVSLALRYNIPVKEIIDELNDISCPSLLESNGVLKKSCPDAISHILEPFKEEK
jgi:ribonucleoside-diphosphate reductase alpha chain